MEYNDLKTYQKVEEIIRKTNSMKLEPEDVLRELNPKDPDAELEDNIHSNMAAIESHEIA